MLPSDYPYCLVNKELRNVIKSLLGKSSSVLELFFDHCIYTMLQELDKTPGGRFLTVRTLPLLAACARSRVPLRGAGRAACPRGGVGPGARAWPCLSASLSALPGESLHGYRICIQALLLDRPKIATANLGKVSRGCGGGAGAGLQPEQRPAPLSSWRVLPAPAVFLALAASN